MTEAQYKMWASEGGCSVAGAPKLASLPSTNEAFQDNVSRAHQTHQHWTQQQMVGHGRMVQIHSAPKLFLLTFL